MTTSPSECDWETLAEQRAMFAHEQATRMGELAKLVAELEEELAQYQDKPEER